jgi:hypothetical protein
MQALPVPLLKCLFFYMKRQINSMKKRRMADCLCAEGKVVRHPIAELPLKMILIQPRVACSLHLQLARYCITKALPHYLERKRLLPGRGPVFQADE